jgi:hypothetical protein
LLPDRFFFSVPATAVTLCFVLSAVEPPSYVFVFCAGQLYYLISARWKWNCTTAGCNLRAGLYAPVDALVFVLKLVICVKDSTFSACNLLAKILG